MNKKYLSLALVSALTVSLLAGCGSSSYSSSVATSDYVGASNSGYSSNKSTSSGIASFDTASSYSTTESVDYDYDYTSESKSSSSSSSSSSESSQSENTDALTLLEEKLVYHCDLDIETTDYQTTMNDIRAAIKEYGGLIQSENETDSSYNWYYSDYTKTRGTMTDYIEVRVPSQKYDEFVSSLDGVGKITSKSTSIENISQDYYDTTTQIEALEIQEKNLLNMLDMCDTIEDMITVQERLSEVQYQLNSLNTTKRTMDTDVAYSYVNISVSEVMEYSKDTTPTKTNTFLDRLKNTLSDTWTGFLAFIEWLLFLVIRLIPYIIIIGILCYIFRKKIRKSLAKHKEKKKARKTEREYNRAMQLNQPFYNGMPPVMPNIQPAPQPAPVPVKAEASENNEKESVENTDTQSQEKSTENIKPDQPETELNENKE
jgi:hypothetical protein